MPIKAKCRKCSKVYTVKDELAGKKFRCKQCQTPVSVPQPAVILEEEPEPEEDLFSSNDFEGDDFGSYADDFDDYDEPVRPKKRKKKPAPKKKRRKKKSAGSGAGAKIGAIFGGVFGLLCILSIVLKIIAAAGGVGGLDFGTTWKSYTTPDGNVTVLMPGTAKSVPVPGSAGNSYGVDGRSYACIISIEPMVGPLAGLSEQEFFNAFEFGAGMLGASNIENSTLNGKNVIKFDGLKAGIKSKNVTFMHHNKIYTMSHPYKGIRASNASKFFNSLKLN